jgi:hypothetical protein
MISGYKMYLLFLLGDLTEDYSETEPNSRYWLNDEYGIVLEFTNTQCLYIRDDIWLNFSNFLSIDYNEVKTFMMNILGEHLGLPERISVTYFHFGFYE